jgi:hypothetical protein
MTRSIPRSVTRSIKEYLLCLFDPNLVPTAFRVAIVIGSVLFMINHGAALLRGEMTRERWTSVGLTYVMPYLVNIHGQYAQRSRK